MEKEKCMVNFLRIVLASLPLKTKIGFKKEMRNHPCFVGDEGNDIYLYFEDLEEKEATIEYLQKSLRGKVPVKIERKCSL